MSDTPAEKLSRNDAELVLSVLRVVERDARVTQRGLSNELGIALGLANAVLKRCVRKGLIKIAQAPLNRYAYYLTPSGFSEKSRLTVEYLRLSFDLFRNARRQYSDLFTAGRSQGWTRVVLFGASELAEAAILSAQEAGVSVVGIVDPSQAASSHVGHTVAPEFGAFAGNADAIAVTDMRDPMRAFELAISAAAEQGWDSERVMTPDLLRSGMRRSAKRRELGNAP